MKPARLTSRLMSTSLAASLLAATPVLAASAPQFDADDIGGVVSSAKGPEAGVWVIAETKDLKTPYWKIVVTDDEGRFVVPDLPKAKYKVWVRGYGLVDSKPVDAALGASLKLAATPAPNAQAAAQIYPANYWYAMIQPPASSDFPGTGPSGNGVSPGMGKRQDWLAFMKENCLLCHQLGDKATRDLAETGNSVEAWEQRIQKAREPGDVTVGTHGKEFQQQMNNNMTRFGRQRALQMLANWTDRVAKGEVPPEAPPRPAGVERNIVLTLWDWADGHFVHDEISSDKRDPTLNANGPIYGTDDLNGHMVVLNPVTHEATKMQMPGYFPPMAHNVESGIHNPMIDQKGRVWLSNIRSDQTVQPFCSSETNKYAKLFPVTRPGGGGIVNLYDPATKKIVAMPVCYGTHHLNFGFDKDHTLYFSGDTNVAGWINTRIYDETKDPEKSAGWCPLVLDTNGDGKITQDRTQWNEPNKPVDPKKDTRVSSFLYGLNISPKDHSLWYAKYSPTVPSGILRMNVGANPPETCITELYEPPKRADGSYAAYNARGVDLDSKGIAWVAFGSGQMGKFDRSKCKVMNGPTATGQQCPEGWTFYDSPGPKVHGEKEGSADWHYLLWVDLHNTLGLGKDVPIMPGTNSDSALAFLPEQEKWVVLRVPYPMGFFSRGMDGRVDDAKTDWKGRGMWANYGEVPLWHQEDGEGAKGKLVKFQVRPQPLAH